MKKLKVLLLVVLTITCIISIQTLFPKADVKKKTGVKIQNTSKKKNVSVVPAKIQVSKEPAEEYQPGDPVIFVVTTPNTNNKVQYRVTFVKAGEKTELYKNGKGYYGPLVSGKTKTTITYKTKYVLHEEGQYPGEGNGPAALIVYAKAEGSKKSYDSYTILRFLLKCR